MSANSHSLAHERQAAHRGLRALMFWIIILSLLPVGVVFAGLEFLIMALAIGLAVVVWVQPQEAVAAGMLYLFACTVLLPSSGRFGNFAESAWQLRYWAVGLLTISIAAVARLGLRRVFTVPRSAQVFLAVAFAAAVYGQAHGATASYVLRQFYGVLLLIVYLGIALNAGQEELLLRRIRTSGVLCAFFFFVYYIAVFGKYGFHKEMSAGGSQAYLLAIILFITGAERKKLSWILGAIALFLVPVLVFMRSGVLTFLVALPTALALKLKSMRLKFLCWAAVALVALPAIYPPVAQTAIDQVSKVPVIERILPPGTQTSETLFERGVQLAEAVGTVQTHPWLGNGLGSAFEWDSPSRGFLQEAFVDSGWGYLFQKMGLLGAAAFLWFLFTVFQSVSRQSAALSACLVSVTLVALFSQPVFFHFTTSPFMGTFAGLLISGKRRRDTGIASQHSTGG